jgi:hypothetical protein
MQQFCRKFLIPSALLLLVSLPAHAADSSEANKIIHLSMDWTQVGDFIVPSALADRWNLNASSTTIHGFAQYGLGGFNGWRSYWGRNNPFPRRPEQRTTIRFPSPTSLYDSKSSHMFDVEANKRSLDDFLNGECDTFCGYDAVRQK